MESAGRSVYITGSFFFIGSVGALKPSFELGDICTPAYSISGGCIHNYLKESIHDQVPFEKVVPTDMDFIEKVVALGEAEGCEVRKASVFCTPTIALEYYHLDEIRAFDGADVKKNRIEEITNSLSQTAVFIAILIFMNAV